MMKMKATIAAGVAAERAAAAGKPAQSDPTSSSEEDDDDEEEVVMNNNSQASSDGKKKRSKKSGSKKTKTSAQTSSFVSADSVAAAEVPRQEPVNFGDSNTNNNNNGSGSRRRVTLGGGGNQNQLFLGGTASGMDRRNSLGSMSLMMDDLFANNNTNNTMGLGSNNNTNNNNNMALNSNNMGGNKMKQRNGSLGFGAAALANNAGSDAASLLGGASTGGGDLNFMGGSGGSTLGRRGSMESTMGALDAAIFDLTRRRYSMGADTGRRNSFVGSMMADNVGGQDLSGLESQLGNAGTAARRSSLDLVLAAATGPSAVSSSALLGGGGGSSITDFGDVGMMGGGRTASRNNSLSLLSSQFNNPVGSGNMAMGGGGNMMMNGTAQASNNSNNMMGMMNQSQSVSLQQQQQQALLQQQLSQQQQQQQQQALLNPTLALRQQQLQAQQRELERRQRELEQQRRELIASMQQRKLLMQQQQRAAALGGFGNGGGAGAAAAGMMYGNNQNDNNNGMMMNQQGMMALQQQQQQGFGNNLNGNMPFADGSLSSSGVNMTGGAFPQGQLQQQQQQGGMAMGNASTRSDMGTQSGRSSHHSGSASRHNGGSSHASNNDNNGNGNNQWNNGGFDGGNGNLAQMQQQMQNQQGFGGNNNFNNQFQQMQQQQAGMNNNSMRSQQKRVSHNPSAASTLPPQQRRNSQFGAQSVHTSTTRASTSSYEPVFSKGPFAPLSNPMPLSMPTDKDWLTPLHCFVRKHCVEVFTASEEDVAAPSKGKRKPIHVGQIGIRCPHCHNSASVSDADMRSRERGSVYYPTTIASIYNATMNLLQRHLHSCPSVPRDIMKRYETLKSDDARSGTSKKYWIESALSRGLVDTETGIRFSPAPPPPLPQLTDSQKDMQRHEEYHSLEKDEGKDDKGGSKKNAKAKSPSKQKDNPQKTDAPGSAVPQSSSEHQGPLTAPEDKSYSTEFSYYLLSQMKPCVFTEADRLGKRKGLPPGFPGLACRHCFGGYGSGRFFPSSIKTLSDTSKTLNVLHNHMMRCRKCPAEVKEDLERLRSTHDEQRAKMKFGSQKAFFARIWDRLHGTSTSTATAQGPPASSAAKRKAGGPLIAPPSATAAAMASLKNPGNSPSKRMRTEP